MAGVILNDAVKLDEVAPLEPGTRVPGLLAGGYELAVVEADPEHAEMFAAISYYRPRAVTALQLVWPDDRGVFPWERGYRYPPEVQHLHTPGGSA